MAPDPRQAAAAISKETEAAARRAPGANRRKGRGNDARR